MNEPNAGIPQATFTQVTAASIGVLTEHPCSLTSPCHSSILHEPHLTAVQSPVGNGASAGPTSQRLESMVLSGRSVTTQRRWLHALETLSSDELPSTITILVPAIARMDLGFYMRLTFWALFGSFLRIHVLWVHKTYWPERRGQRSLGTVALTRSHTVARSNW